MNITDLDENRKWVRLHESNAHQAEAARRITALLAEVERLKAHIARNGIQWCMCSRADRMNERRIPRCPYHGDGMAVQRNLAEQERDEARTESEERFLNLVTVTNNCMEALAERDRLAATVERVETLADEHPDDFCGWIAPSDLHAALKGDS